MTMTPKELKTTYMISRYIGLMKCVSSVSHVLTIWILTCLLFLLLNIFLSTSIFKNNLCSSTMIVEGVDFSSTVSVPGTMCPSTVKVVDLLNIVK